MQIKSVESFISCSFFNKLSIFEDPFAGSGITGIVAGKLKRNAILYEKDTRYFSSILKCYDEAQLPYLLIP